MPKLRLFSLLFLTCLGITFTSFSAIGSSIYLGVVGFGSGNGVAGHAFLLIKDEGISFTMSDFYQYNLKLPDGSPLPSSGKANLDFSSMLFTLDHRIFADTLTAYTDQDNRTISIFELNLTQEEIAQVKQILDQDSKSDPKVTKGTYGILLDNCATRLIDILNSVVTPERWINLAYFPGATTNSTSGILSAVTGSILDRAPFYLAKVLENHPISKGRSRVFEKKSNADLKVYSKLLDELKMLSRECKWTTTSSDAFSSYIRLVLAKPDKFPMDPLYNLVKKTCPRDEQHFFNVLLAMYQLIPDRQSQVAKAFFSQLSEYGSALQVSP